MRLLPLDDSLKEIDVYVLISQISKEFYVWKIKSANTYQAYKDHVNGKFARTKGLFEQSLKEQKMPRMYLLEALAATEEDAFRHCVAWTRYFMEQGLTPLSVPRIINYANDLLPATQEIYDSISGRPMDEVLGEDNCIVSDYKKADKSKKQNKEPKNAIQIVVSHEEYEQIRRRAENAGLSMSRYCKNMALDGKIHLLESPPPWEYIAEIRGAKIIMRQILYAVYKTGKYYPADMENIEKMTEIICEEERKFTKAYHENTKQLLKLLPK